MFPKTSALLPVRMLTVASFGLLVVLALPARAQDGGSNTHPSPPAPILDSYPSPLPPVHATGSTTKPLVKHLPRFSATNVPESGPEELPVTPLVSKNPAPTGLPDKGASQRPILYIGEGYNKMYLINHGKTQWTYSTGGGNEYDDVWMLSNGNVLFTRMYYIAEVTPSKQIVWRYDAPQGTEIHACQPIGFDKVMFVLNGLAWPPLAHRQHLTHQGGQRSITNSLHPPPQTSSPSTPQFRRVRITAQGTYPASFLSMGRVVEYDKDFKEIWSYEIPHPWAAIRLKNGNTLITAEQAVLQREVNPKGETVWELTKDDIPPQYWYGNAQSVTRLDNGDTIVCSRGGDHQGPQLVEVNRDKKVVWVMQDWANYGPATAVQILDDTGYPERPGDSLH